LVHKAWNGYAWESEQLIDGQYDQQIYSAPAASSWSSGRLDVFAHADFDGIVHIGYSTGSGWDTSFGDLWGSSYQKPAPFTSYTAPSAVSWGLDRIDAFVRSAGPGESLWHKWWD
jgi:hypothetical protein